METASLRQMGMQGLRELESELGLLASARDEAYGCIFGRDSLISCLALLRAYRKEKNTYYLQLVERTLRTLANLQGRHTNIESGEEPGKIIHEYRPDRHEHLTRLQDDPWYLYPEGVMRNYDSVDATLLFLLAVDEYAKVGDKHFANTLLPAVRGAMEWLKMFDGFVTYSFHPDRKYGGLKVQSWMDSTESLFDERTVERPPYPIAPVEVQAYAWSALKRWGEVDRAAALKKKFNEKFVLKGPNSVTLAFALDGYGRQLAAPRSSMGHVLWASVQPEQKDPAKGRDKHDPNSLLQDFAAPECILEAEYIPALRNRLLARDLFVPKAGIRTLSNRSSKFDPQSYHNGSIWPHDTAMLAEGLENFGYTDDAKRVRSALLDAYAHFKTPLELYTYKRGLRAYKTESGHEACKIQAWSAASLLAALE